MASIAKEKNGRKRILFVAPDGARKTIRLGKVSMADANAVKVKVERLLAAQVTGHALDNDTANWLAELPDELADKLATVGLAPARERATLGPYLATYFAKRGDLKLGTITALGHTRRCLVEFFGDEKELREITPADADDWARWLVSHEKLSESTVRRRCGIAKQFFRAAVRSRLLRENSFSELKSGDLANDARDFFVSRADAEKVIAACPDGQWRLLFALSRYGGLRCPSEHLALRWGDIDWERGRMRITSPKTEHHPGGAYRIIPLFPELRAMLDAEYHAAPDGTEFVIHRYRSTNANLRTHLLRIIAKAGVKPWPKLFANLRATRATELAAEFPAHVAATWLGHSTLVAQKHYWQTTDADFERAARTTIAAAGEAGSEQAAQNPAQQQAQQSAGGVSLAQATSENARETRNSLLPNTLRLGAENPPAEACQS